MKHFNCRVPGCHVYFVEPGRRLSAHEHAQHVKCGCDWVGVFRMRHLAQRNQRGFDMSKCTPVAQSLEVVHAFLPDWTVHPGALVKEELEACGLIAPGFTPSPSAPPPVSLARLLRSTPEELGDLLACKPEARITLDVARGLATFSASARLWLRLQQDYDDGIQRGLKT